jgi:hypothetical protein
MKKQYSSRRTTSRSSVFPVEKRKVVFSFPAFNFYTKKPDKKVTLSGVRELLGLQGVSKEASCSP